MSVGTIFYTFILIKIFPSASKLTEARLTRITTKNSTVGYSVFFSLHLMWTSSDVTSWVDSTGHSKFEEGTWKLIEMV